MKCPFLKETRVKFCQVSPIKKMIVTDQGDAGVERCSTSSWTGCPLARKRIKDGDASPQCPFLQESFVQYCSLSSITKFIPYTEAPFSRCSNSNHRYCEHYLSMQHPTSAGSSPPASDTGTSGADPNREYRVNGIRIPGKLLYSRNHMWMDESEDGLFHVGVDAFMTKVLGPVEKISFLTTKGIERPTAVLTVNGVDMEVVFPAQILITGLNCYLRSTPEKLSADPYGAGWLFEGQKPKHPGNDDPLLQGTKAVDWMKRESDRLLQFVHNHLQETKLEGKILMADGGTCVDGLARHLHRDDLLKLFHNFFSPYVSWRN